jgi:hypothetical protein
LKKRTKKLLFVCAVVQRPDTAQAEKVFFASFFFRKKKALPSLPGLL